MEAQQEQQLQMETKMIFSNGASKSREIFEKNIESVSSKDDRSYEGMNEGNKEMISGSVASCPKEFIEKCDPTVLVDDDLVCERINREFAETITGNNFSSCSTKRVDREVFPAEEDARNIENDYQLSKNPTEKICFLLPRKPSRKVNLRADPEGGDVSYDFCAVTYAMMEQRVNCLSKMILASLQKSQQYTHQDKDKLSASPRRTVVLISNSSIEFIAMFLAILRANFVCVPVDPSLPKRQIISYLLEYKPICVLLGNNESTLNSVKQFMQTADLAHCFPLFQYDFEDNAIDIIIELGQELPPNNLQCSSSIRSSDRAAAQSVVQDNPLGLPILSNDACILLRTSGTTGAQKTVVLSHSGILSGLHMIQNTLRLSSDDIGINILPLFHWHGLAINVLLPMLTRSCVVLSETFTSPSEFLHLAHSFRISWVSAVPAFYVPLANHLSLLSYIKRRELTQHLRLRFLRNCSAALPPFTGEQLEAYLCCIMLTTYAMTECLPICSNPLPLKDENNKIAQRSINQDCNDNLLETLSYHDVSTVGPPAGPEVALLTAANVLTKQNQCQGEVVVRGPCVAKYLVTPFLDPNESSFFPDGWLRTGDLGEFTERGHLRLCGRIKHVINRAGEIFSPIQLENTIQDHLQKRALAFSIQHQELGESIGIGIYTADANHDPLSGNLNTDAIDISSDLIQTANDVRKCIRNQISERAAPLCVVFSSSFPTTATGKLQRHTSRNFMINDTLQYLRNDYLLLTEFVSSLNLEIKKNYSLDVYVHRQFQQEQNRLIHLQRPFAEDTAVTAPQQSKDEIMQHVQDAIEDVLGCRVETTAPLIQEGADSMMFIVLSEKLVSSIQEMPFLQSKASVVPLSKIDDNLSANQLQRLATPQAIAAHIKSFIADELVGEFCENDPRKQRLQRKANRRSLYNTSKLVESAFKINSGLFAARVGDLNLIQTKIKEGWDPKKTVDKQGLNALHWAAGQGHTNICMFLVKFCGVDVNTTNREGRTALHWACRNNQLKVLHVLIESGANHHQTTKKGVSCLHWAVWGRSLAISKYLVLTLNHDLEAQSTAGCNAAIWAAAGGDSEICQWLWDQGANFKLLNNWGHGVVAKACWHGHIHILRWLFHFNDMEIIKQLFLINPRGESPSDLAIQAKHGQVYNYVCEVMLKNPLPFQAADSKVTLEEIASGQTDFG
eukprot:gene3982-6437_t